MKSIRQTIIVGILFLLSLLVIAYFTIITEGGPFQKSGFPLAVYFPDAEGIKVGGKVTIHGVPFGYVSKIRLVQIDERGEVLADGTAGIGTKVELTLLLKAPINLFDNYQITIKNESLLSGRVVALDPGSKYNIDPKTKQFDMGSPLHDPILLQPKAGKMVPIQGKVTQDPLVSLSELIAENRADIRKSIQNVAEITGKINQGKGTLGKLINESDVHKSVNTTLGDAQVVLKEIREGLEDTREQAPVTSFIRSALSAF
ncbi:ABC transporter substrate binding protein [Leptospira ryugenii]|uniref:ABC transporter substrate binding protein n=1 Tax=Leptospira ryugenii TaxID=1917863 RepID=A0A2P2DX99_9LEPT|nr:MlaD family protein [Leptospira ryugenii]GBF49253.1 ABC transporter substrate binding protein [Leptospira ryugenii]